MANNMLAIVVGSIGALIALLFTALSIHTSTLTRQLSLPTPLFGHILSLILPLLTLLSLLPTTFPTTTIIKTPLFITRQHLQALLLTLLSLLDTVLLTLGATLLQPDLQTCSLEQRWHSLFRAHDDTAIRGIQDALNCCGLRTTSHEAWPWPDNHGATRCRERFGRERSCEPLWRERDARVLAVWVVVGVGGLVIKAVFVMLQRNRPAWFRDESDGAGRRQYSQGRVIEQADDGVAGGRYLDQPDEETPLRSAEAGGEANADDVTEPWRRPQ